MQLNLGQHILSSDSQDVGTIKHFILDPATIQVKAFVIEKGWLLSDDIEIPLEAAQEKGGEEVTVGYTADQVKNLPRFDETLYTSAPPELADSLLGYPAGSLLWPATHAFPPFSTAGYPSPVPAVPPIDRNIAPPMPPEVQDRLRQLDDSNAVISAGDEVLSRDGEKVGEVQNVAFDSVTGRPTHLTLRKGWLFHKDWELPADTIASVDDGVVYLKLNKTELQTRHEEQQYATEWGPNTRPAQRR